MISVAIIPARGGSVRIPRKNIKLFHGKPIIWYSIQAARKSKLFERIVVSTEDDEVAEIAQNFGADVLMRQRHLADDPMVGTQEVVADALRSIPCDFACCIYATAPLLFPDDLKRGLEDLYGYGTTFAYVDGLYYWGACDAFLSNLPLDGGIKVPFPANRYIDINTPDDWKKAEAMYEEIHAIR